MYVFLHRYLNKVKKYAKSKASNLKTTKQFKNTVLNYSKKKKIIEQQESDAFNLNDKVHKTEFPQFRFLQQFIFQLGYMSLWNVLCLIRSSKFKLSFLQVFKGQRDPHYDVSIQTKLTATSRYAMTKNKKTDKKNFVKICWEFFV